MKLKSLSMQGFKSFADRTQIDFMPGITGIVGPNGSGKSNIIEAIRWVMGEQSAKGLRGDKMADVIFGGTKTRAPLNRAEVGIVFDNQDHYLNSDFSEIEIKRLLYRNGDSKYLMNGKQVRLKDVQELFMDSGLGHESFSIISQGRVEHIFSAKAEDRRAIIEDVAGVYKYKQNKQQAGKKLADVQDNLARVTDILYELEQRLEPLAQQSAKAQDYKNQKQAFEQLDQARLQIELTQWEKALSTTTQERDEQSAQQQDLAETLSQAQTELQQQKLALIDQREHQQRAQQNLLEVTQRVEALAGEQKLQAEREQNQKQLVATTTQTLAERQTAATDLEQQLDQAKATADEADAKLAALNDQAQALMRPDDQAQLVTLQKQLADLRPELVTALEQLTTAKNNQHFAQQEHQRADAQTDRYQQRYQTLTEQMQVAQADVEQAQQQAQQAQADLKQAQAKLAQQQTQGQTVEHQYQSNREKWYERLQAQQHVQARVESLQRLNEQYDGYYQGVKQLMKQRQTFPGIRGVVAECIQVDGKYQLAIETALGAALQQVIVDTPTTAKHAIQYLSKNRLGRVTFLPVSTIKGRQLAPNVLQTAQAQPGFLGTAADLVEMQAEFKQIKQQLLGTTVVVDELDHANQMAQALGQRVRLVTLDGQVINAGGSMTGGASRNQQQGLLTQKNELAELSHQLKELNQEVTTLEATVKADQTDLTQLTESFKNQQDLVIQLTEVHQQQAATLQNAQQELSHLEKQRQSLQYDMQLAGVDENQDAQDLQNQIQTAQQEYDRINQDLESTQTQISALQQSLDDANQALVKVQLAQKTAEAEQQHAQEKVVNLTAQLTANADAQRQLKQQLQDLSLDQADVNQRIATEYQANQTAREELVTQLAEIETALQSQQRSLEQKEQAIAQMQGQQQHALATLNQLTARQTGLQTRIEQGQTQLEETYAVHYEPQTAATCETLPEIKDQLKLLKRGLDDIGDVNMNAIAEYAEVKERYAFLSQQKQDLLDAHDDLSETMSEMDEEVKTRFKTTFDAVNAHFEQIFVKMFGGGQAKLYLEQPDNLLETGIDIKAQPPGKKFQQMSLLSGGEKALTAISLLFAILAVRPVPFVVLDETEAALDEANVDRFANYLQSVEQETQFIVITHRQGTMAACDVLYGVTMQEPGVSTMVSVNLNDA
ncbi:chromosome segregation protein SMC [Weissella viridescens]|uniref:Chromosome partition protein Smc n=1 Tax=Weissella viridescens TaxID=1629 RepID=A0A3P2RB49_WEIVI|nr:chromosome segregation protein SMC [Weissella viridescens]RRG17987.1 chromosome segregation protein SMC [Weissella viridescens]